MRRRLLHPPHEAGRINVTPMIDVVMVLIVFFLIVGRLAAERRAPVDLPEARHGSEARAATPFVVNVLAPDGRVTLSGQRYAPEEIALLVRDRLEQDPDLVVQVRADRALAFGQVRPVLDALRGAGVSGVRLAAEEAR